MADNDQSMGGLWWGNYGGGIDGLVHSKVSMFRLLCRDPGNFLLPLAASNLLLPLQCSGNHHLLLVLAGFSFFLPCWHCGNGARISNQGRDNLTRWFA